MKKYKVYLSGGMTGIPKKNAPLFNRAAKKLRSQGYVVVNPIELDKKIKCTTWEECLKRDLTELFKCDAIVLLPGWEKSKGARLEKYNADKLGLTGWFYLDGGA